jgi:hypothetical protein
VIVNKIKLTCYLLSDSGELIHPCFLILSFSSISFLHSNSVRISCFSTPHQPRQIRLSDTDRKCDTFVNIPYLQLGLHTCPVINLCVMTCQFVLFVIYMSDIDIYDGKHICPTNMTLKTDKYDMSFFLS